MLRKKWMSAALASTLTLAMVLGGAGCGGAKDAKDKKSDEASTEKVQKKDKKDGEKVELKFLTYNGIKDADGNYLYQKQIDAYEKENPNVTITLDFQAENNSMDFLKKLDLMQLSGDTADIIQVSAYRDMADRAAQDFFAPLDDNLKEEGIKYEDKYDYPSEINGKHYAIPYNAGLYHVLINEDMMKEAGLSAPKAGWTWEDYRDYANKLTKGDGADKVYGSFMHTWTEYRREGLFNSKMDNPYTKEDGSSDLDNPDLKDWLTFINDMENKDKCQTPYSDAIATNMSYRDVYFQGKAAMILTGSWIYDDINNSDKFPHDFKTVFAPMPVWKDGPAGRTQASASYLMAGKNSKHVDEAYKFMRWMSNEGANVINDFPTEKGADFSSTVKAKVAGHEDLYDVDSLLAIWDDPKLEANSIYQYPDTFKAVDDVFNVETGKYMTGGQDLDTTMKNIKDQTKDSFTKK